jgi:hypothetical protein
MKMYSATAVVLLLASASVCNFGGSPDPTLLNEVEAP